MVWAMGKNLILRNSRFFYWIKEKSSTIKLVGGLKNKLWFKRLNISQVLKNRNIYYFFH